MHTILPTKPDMRRDTLTHGTPPWATLLERMVLASLGAGVMISATILINRSTTTEFIALLGLATALVLAAYSRKLRDGGVNFLADSNGLIFPASSSRQLIQQTRDESWLLVPWEDIVNIDETGVVIGEEGLRPGLEITLNLGACLQHQFFAHLHAPIYRLNNESGQLIVRYHSIFCQSDKTITLLNALRL